MKRIVVSNGVLRFDKLSGNHRQSHTPTRVTTENCARWKNGHVALAGNSGYQLKAFNVSGKTILCNIFGVPHQAEKYQGESYNINKKMFCFT